MSEFKNDPRLRIVYEDDRASYFEEKPNNAEASNSYSSWESYLQAPRQLTLSHSGYSSPCSSSARSEKLSPTVVSSTNELYTDNSSFSSSDSPQRLFENSKDGVAVQRRYPDEPLPTNVDEPAFGRRLIPQIMDNLAAAEPDRIVFSLAKYSKNTLEYRNVSAKAFTAAVDRTAWWLIEQLGKPAKVQPLGYIGPRKLEIGLFSLFHLTLGLSLTSNTQMTCGTFS